MEAVRKLQVSIKNGGGSTRLNEDHPLVSLLVFSSQMVEMLAKTSTFFTMNKAGQH